MSCLTADPKAVVLSFINGGDLMPVPRGAAMATRTPEVSVGLLGGWETAVLERQRDIPCREIWGIELI